MPVISLTGIFCLFTYFSYLCTTYLITTMRHQKSNSQISKSSLFLIILGCLLGLLVLAAIIFQPWYYLEKHSGSYDSEWPYHDQTHGDYSSNYDGIDISRHNGRIHWDELQGNKHLKFIYVKASEGRTHKDPCYERNIREARNHGFLVGSYHFLSKGSSGASQFENFKNTINWEKQDILPMIDAEDDGTKGWSKEEIQEHLRDFIFACKKEYGKVPVIYCSQSYYKDYLSPDFDAYTLFIANYRKAQPVLPGKPKYDIWQFSRRGRIPGIWTWVDLDKFADGMSIDKIRIKN